MSDSLDTPAPESIPPAQTLTTPTGLQSISSLARRRWTVLILNAATYATLLGTAALILGAGGWTVVDIILLVAFAVGTPWTVLGFWNALIGLWLLHARKEPLALVAPFAAAGDQPTPVRIKTAILMTVRNEDPGRAILRLKTVKASLDATGEGGAYSYFILSDTSMPEVAAAEEAAITAWKASDPDSGRIVYRRRDSNTGFKAGNVRDFCERWGGDFALMLPLDADSLMAGPEIVRLTRMMQAHPRIGILQSLVVGMPSASGFARIFQFGMRHGMRSYTMGQAWWVGECGPYWGHNALVRVAPFRECCELPLLPGMPPLGGHVLSHDQVEATLMRRAGYEVRVLPEERGSWEENPPTMLEFAQRDVRWCQGNMQYTKLLDLPGLYAMSRFQLVWAILMFIGIPAWTLMIALLPAAAWQAQSMADFPTRLAAGLYMTFLAMYLSPKLAGLADAMLTGGGVARYGGWLRFTAGAAIELLFSFLQGAVSTVRTTIFMIGLAFGKSVVWGGQTRDAQCLSWRAAAWALWPQMLFGLAVCGALALIAPTVLWWSLPLTAGYLLAVPFAVGTAHPGFGRWLKRFGLCGIPEDFATPAEVGAVTASDLPVQGLTPLHQRRPRHGVRPGGPDTADPALRRSLQVYYGDPAREAAMDRLYARFLRPGALALDVGSHVGDRIGSFRRLGARVVALEPQPVCARAIRKLYGDDPQVTLIEAACGDRAGRLTLRINSANPTVSTASADFIGAADGAGGWEGQVWDGEVEVASTTLDALIARFGMPAFAKIDVEGFEDKVLAGLSRPLPALSFEFTTIQRDVAMRCLDRLEALGACGFDIALGESQVLTFDRWLTKADMAAHIAALPHAANSGDVYCVF